MRALTLLTICSLLPAQSVETLRGQVQSDDVAKVAWAAYTAGKQGHKDLVPDLRRALATLAPEKTRETHESKFLARSILDALIRLEDAPSPQLTGPFTKAFPTMTLVLAARDPKAHAGLLMRRLQGRPSNSAWHATCNLLMTAAPTMLAPHLASRAEMTLEVVVRSDSPIGFGFGGAGFSSACGSMKRPKGFPPTARYTLYPAKRAGARVLAKGPVPVWVVRQERAEEEFGIGRSGGSIDQGAYGLLLLRTMAGLAPADPAPLSDRKIEITWRSAKAYAAEVAQEVADIQSEFDDLLSHLARAKVLSKETAKQLDIRVKLEIRDVRDAADSKTPLPDLRRPAR